MPPEFAEELTVRRLRGTGLTVVLGLLAAAGSLGPASADKGPVIVVPGKPGVPVVINGVDASYSVVTGDWGLARPGHGYVTIDRPAAWYGQGWSGGYYPATGRRPRLGRHEVEPPADRPLPPPAQDYYRSWSVQPDPRPVTEVPPYDPPPVILAPQVKERR